MVTETARVEVAVEEPEAWKRRLTVTVPQERVTRARDRECRKLAKSARLKGFRQGKVPVQVIEQRFGPLLEQRTVQRLLQEAYLQALKQQELQPIGEPKFGDVQYDPGRSFTFQVELEILPELRLDRVSGFRVQRPEVDVSEADVEATLEGLRKQRAVWRPVDRPPTEGDQVAFSITRLDDADNAKPRPYRLELGAVYIIPEVESAIRGMSPGHGEEFDITFPEDSEDPELAGATRRLRIELMDVKEAQLPEVDDEFARDVGELETLEELTTAIREDLQRHAERDAEDTVRNALTQEIIEANAVEVPPAMVARYLDDIIKAPEDADREQVESARDSLRPAALLQIKRHLVVDALAEREGLEATDQDLTEKIEQLAERSQKKPDEIRRRLHRDKRLEELRRQITAEKVFEYLKSQSTVE